MYIMILHDFKTFTSKNVLYNMEIDKITTSRAAAETRKILNDYKNKLLLELPEILKDIDKRIYESISKGSFMVTIEVPCNSPQWQLGEDIKNEYLQRGFDFISYDRMDQENFKIPENGIFNNSFTIQWYKKSKQDQPEILQVDPYQMAWERGVKYTHGYWIESEEWFCPTHISNGEVYGVNQNGKFYAEDSRPSGLWSKFKEKEKI